MFHTLDLEICFQCAPLISLAALTVARPQVGSIEQRLVDTRSHFHLHLVEEAVPKYRCVPQAKFWELNSPVRSQ